MVRSMPTTTSHPRRHLRRSVSAVVMTGALLGTMSPPAAAATGLEAGWWTTLPVAVEPDVSEDSLLVRGGPDPESPIAYAAIDVRLATGERPQTLTLSVTPESATTPTTTLRLCPLLETFTPARGGTADRAPAYDCETSVDADPDDEGVVYEFDVSDLTSAGGLAVAVLPTEVTDRVVLDVPGPEAITSRFEATEPDVAAPPGPPATTPGAQDGSFAPGPSPSPTFSPPPTAGSADLPDPAVEEQAPEAAADTAEEPATETETAAPLTVTQDTGVETNRMAAVGFAFLAGVVAVLWTRAGREAIAQVDAAFATSCSD